MWERRSMDETGWKLLLAANGVCLGANSVLYAGLCLQISLSSLGRVGAVNTLPVREGWRQNCRWSLKKYFLLPTQNLYCKLLIFFFSWGVVVVVGFFHVCVCLLFVCFLFRICYWLLLLLLQIFIEWGIVFSFPSIFSRLNQFNTS